MRVFLFMIFVLISQEQMQAQSFSAPLFFEDSQGRRDTLVVGYDVFGSLGLDILFDEVDISLVPTSDFDVRFFTYENALEEDLPFTCDHENFDLPFLFEDISLHESKVSITESGCSIAGPIHTGSIFTIPFDAAYPVTIRWDNEIFAGDYGCGAGVSWISELARGEILEGGFCPDRINYDSISLTGLDSIVLETPNFKTIARSDSSLLSLYYIYLTDFGSLGSVSVAETLPESVKLYPNPVQDKLFLEIPDQNWGYQILNLQGQQMMQGQYDDFIGVEALPSGIYFLQLQQEGVLYESIKFVIN